MGVTPSVPMEQMQEAGQKAEATLKSQLPIIAERWNNEALHEIRGYHDKWNAFNLTGASTSDLLAHIDWTLNTFE